MEVVPERRNIIIKKIIYSVDDWYTRWTVYMLLGLLVRDPLRVV
jgi:hypothetical protein